MPNPAASGTATLLVLSQLMDKGEESGWAYFDALVENVSSFPDSGGAPAQAAAATYAYTVSSYLKEVYV